MNIKKDINYHKAENKDKMCNNCINFKSYDEIYDDYMEPWEYGECIYLDDFSAEFDHICDNFEERGI